MITPIFVAIICRRDNIGVGLRHPITITGTNQTDVIVKAIRSRDEMISRNTIGVRSSYAIFVGEVTREVAAGYTLVNIETNKEDM